MRIAGPPAHVHSGDIVDGLLASEFPELQLLQLGLCGLASLSDSSAKVTVRETRGLDDVELRAGLVHDAEDGGDTEGADVAVESVRLGGR